MFFFCAQLQKNYISVDKTQESLLGRNLLIHFLQKIVHLGNTNPSKKHLEKCEKYGVLGSFVMRGRINHSESVKSMF